MKESDRDGTTWMRSRQLRGTRGFILAGLTSGHAVFHFLTQSFMVMLPYVQHTFALAAWQVGAITSTREMASGITTLPGGLMADRTRRHWGLLLALCMAGFGLGWLTVSLAPAYPLVLLGMVLVAISASTWHLPAAVTLSHYFSRRRGFALSIHGIGGSIGDVLGPVVTGTVLVALVWQRAVSFYSIIPLLLAFVVLWAFKDIGREMTAGQGPSPTFRDQLRATGHALRDITLWKVNLVAGLRGMSYVTYITFLPLYMSDELGFGSVKLGLHTGLLVGVGIVATPVMGHLSDKFGRKQVLVPGLIGLCSLSLLLVNFGSGIPLIFILAALGLFLYSDQPILSATVLDIVGRRVATTILGVLHFSRFVLSAISPLIGGILYDRIGVQATFYYAAGLFAMGAVLLITIRLRSADGDDPVAPTPP